MPQTKAGKQLEHDHFDAAVYCGMTRPAISDAIDAIEAEAREEGYALGAAMEKSVAALEAIAERERIENDYRKLRGYPPLAPGVERAYNDPVIDIIRGVE
jgi:hypothetical protein